MGIYSGYHTSQGDFDPEEPYEPVLDDEDSDVKYPNITVQLTGNDGNAFAILGRMTRALRQHGVSADECMAFRKEATAGDYDHLLQTCMRWVNVE